MLVEQRYPAVLEVLEESVSVTEVARRYGWCGRRCTRGCAGMPKTGWAGWRTSRRGQSVNEADRMGGGIARA